MASESNSEGMARQIYRRFFSVLQRVGQALMTPVSVLPAAGLLVAVGRSLENKGQITNVIGEVLFNGGIAIFQQLPLIFAIGVAIGFTGGAGVAGLSAAIGYFTLINVLKAIQVQIGLETMIDTGVFGGILVGLLVAAAYNRYHKTNLPAVLGFFSGKRLVPILSVGICLILAVMLSFIWPPVQSQIQNFGLWVLGSDFGPAFFAAGKRALIPVGLHHVYYSPFLFQFGEFVSSAGEKFHGDMARYYAGDPTAGRFMASEFPIMLFGLPGAALAIWARASANNQKQVAAMMLSAAVTSILTGITEPIEFAFIFVAPLLFVFHVACAFVSGVLTNFFELQLGFSFSPSLIDFVLGYFNAKNSWALFVIGPFMFCAYFFVFYWAIKKFGLRTPGRDGDVTTLQAETDSKLRSKAISILEALGGSENIIALEACITRLRLEVADSRKVDDVKLKSLGAAGVFRADARNIQVVFGVESDLIKEELRLLMESGEDQNKEKSLPSNFVSSPLTGRLMELSEVPDQTFSKGILGPGFAIEPVVGELRSPVEGEVIQVFRTGHAIGLRTTEGGEILIHVGIDTVKLKGQGFESLVKEGQKVRAGDLLMRFDVDLIRGQGFSLVTPVVFTEIKGFSIQHLVPFRAQVETGTVICQLTKD